MSSADDGEGDDHDQQHEGGVYGAIVTIGGSSFTVKGVQNTVTVTVSTTTKFVGVKGIADLKAGMRVAVLGVKQTDGSIAAQARRGPRVMGTATSQSSKIVRQIGNTRLSERRQADKGISRLQWPARLPVAQDIPGRQGCRSARRWSAPASWIRRRSACSTGAFFPSSIAMRSPMLATQRRRKM